MEIENEDYTMSKLNRRNTKDSEGEMVVKHPFKRFEHPSDKKFTQRRKHQMERKALRKK